MGVLRLLVIACVLAFLAAGVTAGGGNPSGLDEAIDGTGMPARPETRSHLGQWALVAAPDDRAQLVVRVFSGGCISFDRFEVEENEAGVAVRAVMTETVLPENTGEEPHGACTSDLRAEREIVRLGRPLGDRALLGECEGERPSCADWGPSGRRVRPG